MVNVIRILFSCGLGLCLFEDTRKTLDGERRIVKLSGK